MLIFGMIFIDLRVRSSIYVHQGHDLYDVETFPKVVLYDNILKCGTLCLCILYYYIMF